MDWVDALHETPDLCGEIEVLDYRAVFNGSYSCVYKGRMKGTDELVAIKVLNPIRGTGLSTMRRKIERERKTWSSLRHPNILPLYGFADDHKLFTPFGAFISPWRKRGDLGEFLFDEGENASLKVRLQLWQGVVAGVHHLHSHQPLLVHGDLKPGNVLIDDDWNAQLCDFGLVRVYLSEGHSGMTTASPYCGTERYLAWELVMADEDAIPTAASDIYATGCIGLEALFLEQPYSRYKKNVRGQIMRDMDEGKPPAFRPASLMGHLDSLWEIVSWCWASDPLSRPQAHVLSTHVANILAIVESLEQSVSAHGVGEPQSGLWSPEAQSKDHMATDRSGEMLVEISNPPNLASKTNIGGSGVEQNFGIDSVVRQGGKTAMRGDDNDYMDIDEISSAVLNEAKAPLNTSVQTEVVGATPGIPTLSNFAFTDLEDQVMQELNWDWIDATPAGPHWCSTSQTYEIPWSSGCFGPEEDAASSMDPYHEFTLAPATNKVPQILAPNMSEDQLSSPMLTPGCSGIRVDFSLGASHTLYRVAHESRVERDLKPSSKSVEQYPATVASGASFPVPETGARLLYDEDDGCANPRKRRKLSDNGTSDTDNRRATGIVTQTPMDRKRGHYYPPSSAAPGSPTAYQRAFRPQRKLHRLGHTSLDRMPKPTRRSRVHELKFYSDDDTAEGPGQQIQPGGSNAGGPATQLPGACAPCKVLQMKCVFPEGQRECCQRCHNSGRASQCVVGALQSIQLSNEQELPLGKLSKQDTLVKSKDAVIKPVLEAVPNAHPQISLRDSPAVVPEGDTLADLQNASHEETRLGMDTNPMWNAQPLFDGRGMRYDSANMVISETPAGLAPYAYDAGRPHLSYPSEPPEAVGTGFPAPGTSANGGRLNLGTSAASMSPYSTRPTIGFAGSLQRSPASTTADPHLDSQVYSHNQHGEHYGHINPASQYAREFDYPHLAQPTHGDPMSSNLQQHAEAIYTSDPHAQYYHSSHSHSPASPRLPLRSSPHQAMYHQSYAGPNLAVNPFTTVDDIVKINQVSYLPTQNHLLQSPLPAVSSPSEISEPPERHSPTLQGRSRVPGHRVDVDGKMLENSFRGNDDQSRMRRQVLDDIQRQPWFHSNQDEPKMDVHFHREILKHGLGMVGRSIYTVFLVEDKDSNQWRCLFGSEEMSCKKSDKRFERVERAIEHVRSHLGHRPFACDGTCHKAKSTGINCKRRYFAAGYLEDHKKLPQTRGAPLDSAGFLWDHKRRHEIFEAKETCTICDIPIYGRNMERHRLSRHPNHIGGVSETDTGPPLNNPIP